MLAKYYLLLTVAFFNSNLIAQPRLLSDTSFVSSSIDHAYDIYKQELGGQIQLYNGGAYKDYVSLKGEHPYFLSEDWAIGEIHYNGAYFDQVPLLYNIYSNQVITETPSAAIMIQLVRDKITSFTLHGRSFVFLKENTSPGFYELLCFGPITLYSRHVKEFLSTTSHFGIEHEFFEKTRYYILKEDTFYTVGNRKSVLNVLADRKRELRQFIRKNHLKFQQEREDAIVNVVNFYNEK
jgi:hypothetical protein